MHADYIVHPAEWSGDGFKFGQFYFSSLIGYCFIVFVLIPYYCMH